MSQTIYILCVITAACCAWLLFRAFRRFGARLLWWSGMCFALQVVSNAFILVDFWVFPSVDLFVVRNAAALLGVIAMLYGLIWDAR